MGYKLVPLLLANKLLKIVEEIEALLVRDAGKGIIGVLALQVDNKLCEFVIFAVVVDAVSKSLPPDNGREIAVSLSM